MIVVVGLGNPGKKYIGTRHNIGKEIIKNFAKAFDFPTFKVNKKLLAEITKNNIDSQEIVLALPTTFMNESGQAVKRLIANSKLPIANLWIVHDDIDLPLGKIRISENRSAAGHKGVQSIIDNLGTQNFIRFRIGIKHGQARTSNTDKHGQTQIERYVLEKFTKDEQKNLENVIQLTIDALKFAIKNDIKRAMNKYN